MKFIDADHEVEVILILKLPSSNSLRPTTPSVFLRFRILTKALISTLLTMDGRVKIYELMKVHKHGLQIRASKEEVS